MQSCGYHSPVVPPCRSLLDFTPFCPFPCFVCHPIGGPKPRHAAATNARPGCNSAINNPRAGCISPRTSFKVARHMAWRPGLSLLIFILHTTPRHYYGCSVIGHPNWLRGQPFVNCAFMMAYSVFLCEIRIQSSSKSKGRRQRKRNNLNGMLGGGSWPPSPPLSCSASCQTTFFSLADTKCQIKRSGDASVAGWQHDNMASPPTSEEPRGSGRTNNGAAWQRLLCSVQETTIFFGAVSPRVMSCCWAFRACLTTQGCLNAVPSRAMM